MCECVHVSARLFSPPRSFSLCLIRPGAGWRVRENLRRRRHVERLDVVVRKAMHLFELVRVSARLDEQLETLRLATSRCGECGGLHEIIASVL